MRHFKDFRDILVVLGVVVGACLNVQGQVDLTLDPLGVGEEVVLASLRKLYGADIFEDDFFLAHRVAQVVSAFGMEQPSNGTLGIWRITPSQFTLTQNSPALSPFLENILLKFPLDVGNWSLLSYEEDAGKPLVNLLTFRLYVETLTRNSIDRPYLPSLLVDQASFYSQIVNPELNFDPEVFINSTVDFESFEGRKCSTEMDVVFVQDGSCTVYPSNFTDGLQFFAGLMEAMDFQGIRVGHTVYSTEVRDNFDLNQEFENGEKLKEAILNASRPNGQYTETASGLTSGLSMLQSAVPERPESVAKVMISFTDGMSIQLLDEISNSTREAGVNVFSFGTAFGWSQDQMLILTHDDPTRILKNGYTYNLQTEFLYRSHLALCSVAQTPSLGVPNGSVLTLGEKRFYRYSLQPGITFLNIRLTRVNGEGSLEAFYSFSEQLPNSAIHQGLIDVGVDNTIGIIPGNSYLYIGIKGLSERNPYAIVVSNV